jgi:hypothetical protein
VFLTTLPACCCCDCCCCDTLALLARSCGGLADAANDCDDGGDTLILGTERGPQMGKRRSAGVRRRVGDGAGQIDIMEVFFIQATS